MRGLLCFALLGPLSLAAQAPVAGPTYAALRHGIQAPESGPNVVSISASVRKAPRWVVGGVIGGVVTAGLVLAWVRVWDGYGNSRTSMEVRQRGTRKRLRGFVIGSLIAGRSLGLFAVRRSPSSARPAMARHRHCRLTRNGLIHPGGDRSTRGCLGRTRRLILRCVRGGGTIALAIELHADIALGVL